MHDIVLVWLGLDILEGDIAKSSQADLSKRAINDRNHLEGWPPQNPVGVFFVLRAIALDPLLRGGCVTRKKGCECDLAGVNMVLHLYRGVNKMYCNTPDDYSRLCRPDFSRSVGSIGVFVAVGFSRMLGGVI